MRNSEAASVCGVDTKEEERRRAEVASVGNYFQVGYEHKRIFAPFDAIYLQFIYMHTDHTLAALLPLLQPYHRMTLNSM